MAELDKFIVYVEEIESLKELSNEEIGIFFRAVTEYVKSGIVPNLPERLVFPFRFITAHISRDQKKYKDISEKRKIAGKKGLDARMRNKESGLSEENEKYVENVKNCVEEAEKCVEDTEQCVENAKQCFVYTEQHSGETEQRVENTKQCVGETEQRVGNANQCVVYTEQNSGETEQRVGNVEQHIESTEQCTEEPKKYVDEELFVGDAEQCENVMENTEYFLGYEDDINNNNSNEELKKSVENKVLFEESFKERFNTKSGKSGTEENGA